MTSLRDFNINHPLSLFEEAKTTAKTPIIELNSTFELSNLRDVVFEDGSEIASARGSSLISNANSEFTLSLPATASKSVELRSAEPGRYQPGHGAQVGVGIRCTGTLSGEQVQKWGYFDDSNGFYFKRTASGVSVGIMRGGTETLIAKNNWNIDTLSGLDITDGSIYEIDMSLYTYGAIIFNVVMVEGDQQKVVPVHIYKPSGQTSSSETNLPISVRCENGATAAAQTLYVGGRQFNVIGRFNPITRRTSQQVSKTGIGTSWTPIATFRRKSGFESVRIKPNDYTALVATNDIAIKIVLNGSLTGASYGAPAEYNAAETAVEVDTSATGLTGGETIFTSLNLSGTGNSKAVGREKLGGVVVPSFQPVTLMAKALSGTADIDVDWGIEEEW